MNDFRDAIERVERRRKRLEVYTGDAAVAIELQRQFAARNVDVVHEPVVRFDGGDFVIVRGPDGEFRGAFGLEQLDQILSPEIHPPWALASGDTSAVFDFLENTVFASYDRRQMLATAREIEERAWRTGEGRLYAGFQRESALVEQAGVYERLANRATLSATVILDGEWRDSIDGVDVVTDDATEIGQFWFVIFDGGGSRLQSCALVAEERRPGRYYGFWTYDPSFVDGLVDYLESTYELP